MGTDFITEYGEHKRENSKSQAVTSRGMLTMKESFVEANASLALTSKMNVFQSKVAHPNKTFKTYVQNNLMTYWAEKDCINSHIL